MSDKWRYDVYTVKIPTDIFPNNSEDFYTDICNTAISEAEERAYLYCLPAFWTAKVSNIGDQEVTVRVVRKRVRNYPVKVPEV